MKLCPICERWRNATGERRAVAICGKCFLVVDNERATITAEPKKPRREYDGKSPR